MQCRWRYKGDARDVLSFNGYSSRAASDASRKQSTRRSREESYFCKCIRTIATNECVVYVFGNNSVSPSECPKWELDSFNSKPRMLNKYNVVKPKKAVDGMGWCRRDCFVKCFLVLHIMYISKGFFSSHFLLLFPFDDCIVIGENG